MENSSGGTGPQALSKPAWNLVGARPQQQQNRAIPIALLEPQDEPDATVSDNQAEGTGRKKKKKLSKSERLAKREEKALKQIYGPKDAHISLISAADLRKFQQGSSSTISKASKTIGFAQDDFPSIGGLTSTSNLPSSTCPPNRGLTTARRLAEPSLDDFPVLGATRPGVVEVEEQSSQSESVVPGFGLNEETLRESSLPELQDAIAEAPKTISEAPAVATGKKKSKKPIVIALDTLLTQAIESEKSKEKPAPKLVAAAKPVPKKTVGNLLDSTGPVLINRGKIRESPKNKKPTKLKKAILASRASRQIGSQEPSGPDEDADINQDGAKRSFAGDQLEGEEDLDLDELQIVKDYEELQKVDVKDIVATATASSVHNEVLIQLLNLALSEQTHVDSPEKIESKVIEATNHSEELMRRIKCTMHSRKFRPYCDMYPSKELHGYVIALLKELHRFQDRLYHTDPLKYQLKRRYVHGIKNVLSYLQINKVVLVIMAPDIEPSAEPGGLDDQISAILSLSKDRNVPVVFSGNRYILGKPLFIKTPVSSVAVLNRSGADEIFKTLLEQAEVQRAKYQEEFLQRVRSEANSTNLS